ncbi:MAG: tRNA pseudouridine(55) synthase TruB, partial [Bacteroidales bacterium]
MNVTNLQSETIPTNIHPLAEGKILLVNKPYTWTSFNVVSKIRIWARRESGLKNIKVGHAGTLDPLATGLLILCIGKFTKRIDEFQAFEKEYTGTFVLGSTTKSFDLESEVIVSGDISKLTAKEVVDCAAHFTGNQMQTPPTFSAVKVDGKRAYELARENKEMTLTAKPIEIKVFEITRVALPEIDFRIVCSKGTYIRAIARDIGE